METTQLSLLSGSRDRLSGSHDRLSGSHDRLSGSHDTYSHQAIKILKLDNG